MKSRSQCGSITLWSNRHCWLLEQLAVPFILSKSLQELYDFSTEKARENCLYFLENKEFFELGGLFFLAVLLVVSLH
jgi:hypothetical protein